MSQPEDSNCNLVLQTSLPAVLSHVYGDDERDESTTNQSQAVPDTDDPAAAVFEGLAKLLRIRLESEVRNLEQLRHDEAALLEMFVESWRKYKRVIDGLQECTAHFCGTLKKDVEDLYTSVILDKIEETVRQAALRVFQQQNHSDDNVETAGLLKSVSAVFYYSQRALWSSYEKRWHEPIIFHLAKLYFQKPLERLRDDTNRLLVLDFAITEACVRVGDWCPDDRIERRAHRMLKGIGRIQTYYRVRELLEDNRSRLFSLFRRGRENEINHLAEMCDGFKNLKFVSRLVFRKYTKVLGRNIKDEFVLRKEIASDVSWVQSIDAMISVALQLLDHYLIIRENEESLETALFKTWSHHAIEFEFTHDIQNCITRELRRMLYNEELELNIILKSNNIRQILDMYACFVHTGHLPDMFGTVVTFEIEEQFKGYIELIEDAQVTDRWFGDGGLKTIESEILKVFGCIYRRSGVWKDPTTQFSCRICSAGDQTSDQNIHRTKCAQAERQLKEKIQIEIVPRIFQAMTHKKSSQLLHIFKRDDEKQIMSIYKEAMTTWHLWKLCRSMLLLEIQIRTDRIWKLVDSAVQKWFDRDSVMQVDAALREAICRVKDRCIRLTTLCRRCKNRALIPQSALVFSNTPDVLGTRLPAQQENRIKDRTAAIVMDGLRNMWEHEESNFPSVFKRRYKEEIDRIYGVCSDLDPPSLFRDILFKTIVEYEVERRTAPIWSFMGNVTGNWIENLVRIDSKVMNVQRLLRERCDEDQENIRLEQEERVKSLFDINFERIRKHIDMLIRKTFRSENTEDIALLYRTCYQVFYVNPKFCETLMRHDIRISTTKIWTRFEDALRKRQKMHNLSSTDFAKCEASQQFINSLIALLSRWETTSNSTEEVIQTCLNRTLNNFLGEGVPTMVELFVHNIDLVMRGPEQLQAEAGLYHHIFQVTKLLSYPNQERSCKRLSELCLANRLVQKGDFSKPGPPELLLEHHLIACMRQNIGDESVGDMRVILADFESGLATEEKIIKQFSTRNKSTRLGQFTRVRPISGRIWSRLKEYQFKLPPALEDSASQFENYYRKEEPKRRLEYAHSLGKVSVEMTILKGESPKDVALIGSVQQASILCLFDSRDNMTFEDVLEDLQVQQSNRYAEYMEGEAQIYAAVRSLLSLEFPLLKKDPESDRIGYQDVLSLNENFTTTEKRLHLPEPTKSAVSEGIEIARVAADAKSTKSEPFGLNERVQSAVTKLMKQKKRKTYSNLYEDIDKLSKSSRSAFRLNRKLFKKAVQYLIDEGYLQRDEGDKNVLTYIR